ncbi:MAG: hypothetical protein JSU85_01710 [Candidatus Zixiibacteriota bacterium]|nr:MAG: hypothetical protein JSU85_01710 [candidate division Zixibacteria bacterium]
MLYSTGQNREITYIPHERDYNLWRGRLSEDEYRAIIDELNNRIDSDEVHTSSWIPGSDWTDTVFQPIYEKACNYDERLSGKCFGLFLWVVMMNRPEFWAFGRYEKDGIPIEGLTYFRVQP